MTYRTYTTYGPERESNSLGRHRGGLYRGDLAYQEKALAGVSRTFALTIPELPPDLRLSVGNAYLLCRIADSIEDAPGLGLDAARAAHAAFWNDLHGHDVNALELPVHVPQLEGRCTEAELDLLQHLPEVLRITWSLPAEQRAAITRCVRIMTDGMQRFQAKQEAGGLETQAELDEYCYCVAGVVGEMLTELFCAHAPEVAAHRETMYRLSAAFGRGLQMTNILKDVWDDAARGVCWLPAELLRKHGVDRARLGAPEQAEAFAGAVRELSMKALRNLDDAMAYVYEIPAHEGGIRRFCVFAIGLAVFTVRKIHANPRFASADALKIKRNTVYVVVAVARAICGSDVLLRCAYAACTRGLARG